MGIKWWQIMFFIVIMVSVAAVLHPTKMRTGWMFFESNKVKEAVSNLEEAYKQNPKNHRALALMAKGFEHLDNLETATKYFDKLIKTKPKEQYFEEAVRFYSWTRQYIKEKQLYEKWYDFRKRNKQDFLDENGNKILKKLYAFYLNEQEYTKAIKILNDRAAVNKIPYKTLTNELISLYEKTGNTKKTIELLQEALKKDSRHQFVLDKFVELAPYTNHIKQAEAYLKINILEEPDVSAHWQRMINLQTRLKNTKEANHWYLEWIIKHPNDFSLKRNYLAWMLGNNLQKQAIDYIEKLPSIKEQDPYFYQTLTQLYEWNNNNEKLVPIYENNFNKNPKDLDNADKLINQLLSKKDYHNALITLNKIRELFPHTIKYGLLVAQIYDAQNKTDAATALLESIALASNDLTLLKKVAKRYFWAKRNTHAKALFYKLYKETPQDYEIYFYLGDIDLNNKNYEEAKKRYTQGKDLNPEHYYPHFKLGEICLEENNKTCVQEHFKMALAKFPEKETDIYALISKGVMLAHTNNKPVCLNHFNKLYSHNKNNPEVMLAYAESLILFKEINKAHALASSFVKQHPDSINPKRLLARTFTLKDEHLKAANTLKELFETYPHNHNIKTDYAYALSAINHWQEAMPLFKELSEKHPNNRHLKNIYLDLFRKNTAYASTGYEFMRIGNQNRHSPYLNIFYPFNNKWRLNVNYTYQNEKTNLAGINSHYQIHYNKLDTKLTFTPDYKTTYTFGLTEHITNTNDFSFSPYASAQKNFFELGLATLNVIVNQSLEIPATAKYYEARQSLFNISYANSFLNKVFFQTTYTSTWFRLNADKTTMNTPNSIGREDKATAAIHYQITQEPTIMAGYDITYSKLHMNNNYQNQVSLIQEAFRHDFSLSFYHNWSDNLTTNARVFVSHDFKRNLSLADLDVYGFSLDSILRLSKLWEVHAHYEYASESMLNTNGKYQLANFKLLYRF